MRKDPTILVVDDEERNVRLLTAMLAPEKYRLVEALNGEEALQKVQETRPDLILLDVMMPGMSGYEVCKKLKKDEMSKMIPVLMVTVLSSKEDRVKAMEVGADDFLSKPIDKIELLIRVKSLLRIKSYHDQLSRQLGEIQDKNDKLSQLERMKEELMHMIIHDMNAPLVNLGWGLSMLMEAKEEMPKDSAEIMDAMLANKNHLDTIVQNILDVYKMGQGKLDISAELCNLAEITKETLKLFKYILRKKRIVLSVSDTEGLPQLWLDAMLIRRVIANLVNNAIAYTPYEGKILVVLQHRLNEGTIRFSIHDSGPGIEPEYHEKVFDRFQQVSTQPLVSSDRSCGLGLTFCKMAVEAHGGTIWVESTGKKSGCTFHFALPLTGKGGR